MAEPNSNAGIYFHTAYQDSGWPKAGFETQVNNTYHKDPRKTGSLYAVQDVTRQLIPDNVWWTQHVIVQGKRAIIKVDGKVVATQVMEKTIPMILQWDESFDIGSDTLTGVNDADYKPPFPLTAKLNKLTIKVERPQLSADDIKKLEAAMRNNKSSE